LELESKEKQGKTRTIELAKGRKWELLGGFGSFSG